MNDHSLEFFYDYRSPYTYLALTQLWKKGIKIDYHPFEIRELMTRVGNVPTSVVCKPKNKYTWRDLDRWAAHYGVPFAIHPDFATLDRSRMLRATLASDAIGDLDLAVPALFKAMWIDSRPLGTEREILDVLLEGGVSESIETVFRGEDAYRSELNVATEYAIERGVFGSPTFFVGPEMFFGNDRLNFVYEALESAR